MPVLPPKRMRTGVVAEGVPFGADGYTVLAPRACPVPVPSSLVVDELGSVFDHRRFSTPRTPVVISTLADLGGFAFGGELKVSSLPVKFPDSEVRLPGELEQFSEMVQHCVDVDAVLNPLFDECFMYLTVSRAAPQVGVAHRDAARIHSDGVQGPRIQPKTVAPHCYVVVDRDPTLFFTGGVDLGDAHPDTHYLDAVFAEVVDRTAVFVPAPGEIVLFDTYCPHAARPASTLTLRTFARVCVTTRRFDRLGNAHNAAFDYDWEMVPRPLPAGLIGGPG